MPDDFRSYGRSMTAPAGDAFVVTPSDGADFARAARALYVGGAGDVAVRTLEGTDVVFRFVSAGSVLPVSALRVRATGTTAQFILGLI